MMHSFVLPLAARKPLVPLCIHISSKELLPAVGGTQNGFTTAARRKLPSTNPSAHLRHSSSPVLRRVVVLVSW